MTIFLIIVHIFVCLFLILVILLQAGKGQGLSNIFGGGAQEVFGAKTPIFLAKATAVCAALFLITSISLAIISKHQQKSVMEKVEVGKKLPAKQEAVNTKEQKAEKQETKETKNLKTKELKDVENK